MRSERYGGGGDGTIMLAFLWRPSHLPRADARHKMLCRRRRNRWFARRRNHRGIVKRGSTGLGVAAQDPSGISLRYPVALSRRAWDKGYRGVPSQLDNDAAAISFG
jgi:hypothetical protein